VEYGSVNSLHNDPWLNLIPCQIYFLSTFLVVGGRKRTEN